MTVDLTDPQYQHGPRLRCWLKTFFKVFTVTGFGVFRAFRFA